MCPGNGRPELTFLLCPENFKPNDLSFPAAQNTLCSSSWNHHPSAGEEWSVCNYSFSSNLFVLLPGTMSFIFWLTRLCSLTITSQITATGSSLNQPWRWKILRTTCCTRVIFTCWGCWAHSRRQLSSQQVTPHRGNRRSILPSHHCCHACRELHFQLSSGKKSALRALRPEEGLFSFLFFVQAVENCSSPWV